jgi:O-acetyl-ADP-ribose deacetylase (regulator of RNase III)
MSIAEKIEILQSDITDMDVDAIVNAANNDLQLGAGVAGAIRRKGGDAIQRECNGIGTIPVGGAVITTGGKLKARHVIHAASMSLGGATTAPSLRRSVHHCLRIAAEKELKTIAFPAVGTGIAGFPMRDCAQIMLEEAVSHLKKPASVAKIYFVLFDHAAKTVFDEVFAEMAAQGKLETGAAGTAAAANKAHPS